MARLSDDEADRAGRRAVALPQLVSSEGGRVVDGEVQGIPGPDKAAHRGGLSGRLEPDGASHGAVALPQLVAGGRAADGEEEGVPGPDQPAYPGAVRGLLEDAGAFGRAIPHSQHVPSATREGVVEVIAEDDRLVPQAVAEKEGAFGRAVAAEQPDGRVIP